MKAICVLQEMKANPVFALWTLLRLDVAFYALAAAVPRPAAAVLFQAGSAPARAARPRGGRVLE